MPTIFFPREIREGETRVSAVPETVQRLTRDGFTVSVQRGAGVLSMISDDAYEHAGARLSEDPASACAAADLVAKFHPPTLEAFLDRYGPEKLLFGSDFPFSTPIDCLKAVLALGLPKEDEELVLRGNVLRLIGR